jgi:hypothetical protein
MSKPKGALGEVANPAPALRRAARELADARAHGDRLRLREAAEKAYLAACQAADCAAAGLGRSAPRGRRRRLDALEALDAKHGTNTELLFRRVHDRLHATCFHEDVCDPKLLDRGFRETAELVEAVASHIACRRPARPRR